MTEALRMEQLREQAGELAIEQHLLLSGWVYGFTDQAHKRIYDLLADDKVLPVDLDKAIIFYTNPSPSPKGQKIGAVGPAASLNMDIYLPQMMDLGVIATIGKGERSKEAYETIQKHGGVYLTAVGIAFQLHRGMGNDCFRKPWRPGDQTLSPEGFSGHRSSRQHRTQPVRDWKIQIPQILIEKLNLIHAVFVI